MGISVIGLIDSPENLTLATWNLLTQADCVYLASPKPALEAKLRSVGQKYKSCQELSPEDRAGELLSRALEDLVYIAELVPAEMDKTVQLLGKKAQLQQTDLGEALSAKLGFSPQAGVAFLNKTNARELNSRLANLIWGPLDGEALQKIQKRYLGSPEDLKCKLCYSLGSQEERIEELAFNNLSKVDPAKLCCIFISKCRLKNAGEKILELEQVMARLRGDDGCPWDREQTLGSLQPYLIEEAYEVLDALAKGDPEAHCEELGDLLLQIVFQSRIAQEEGKFCLADVIASETAKMIRRHPHVFGDVNAETSADVLVNWEIIKAKEREGQRRKSLLDGVPVGLPSLARAYKVQDKAAQVGFQWEDIEGALEKANEELLELTEAIESGQQAAIEEEFGDLFFALVNVARYLDVYPEVALSRAVGKFERRFRYIEQHAGCPLQEMTLSEMDKLWDEAKALE